MRNFFQLNFKIQNKKIGKKQPTFIIAEAGVNHNGSLKVAFKLIDLQKKQAQMLSNFKHLTQSQVPLKI